MTRPPRACQSRVVGDAAITIAMVVATVVAACGPAAGARPVVGSSSPEDTLGPSLAVPGGTVENPGLPTLIPESVLTRVPTRVRVPALHIDLPVVEPPPDPNHYPYCDVAEFIPTMSRPGRPGTTFLYAHARTGMFLPILEAARRDQGAEMLGMSVEVYTSDNRLFTYQVSEVRRDVQSLDFAFRATAEQLVLQTSEGPHGTIGKTLLIAIPRGEQAASARDAQPAAHPVACGFG
jgi:Sortase domain